MGIATATISASNQPYQIGTGDPQGSVLVGEPGHQGGNVTAAGNVTGNATVLLPGVNFVAGADGTKGVRISSNLVGGTATVIINKASANLPVYPPTGGTINGGSTDAALTMGNSTVCTVWPAADSLTCFTDPHTPS